MVERLVAKLTPLDRIQLVILILAFAFWPMEFIKTAAFAVPVWFAIRLLTGYSPESAQPSRSQRAAGSHKPIQ